MKKFVFLFLLITTNLFSFYLSTEKSFSPEEESVIKIESSYEKSVNVRLYQITDMETFLSSAKELDRIYFGDSNIKDNPTVLLFRYLNIAKNVLREMGRRVFGGNYKLASEIKAKNSKIIEQKYYPPKKVIEKLKYKVVKEFKIDLESKFSSWSYKVINFGKLPSGLYLAEVYNDEQLAYTLILVSQNALLVKKSDKELFIMMVDKKTGNFVPAKIEIFNYKTGKKVGGGNSTSEKAFIYDLKNNENSDFLVFGETIDKNKEKVFYKFSTFPSPKLERMVYVYTDSPVYKEGNDVNIKMVVRDYEGSVYKIPEGLDFKSYIVDPLGTRYNIEITNKLDEFGCSDFKFSVPEYASKGIYKIICEIEGKKYIGEFRVEEYVAPDFSVNVTTTKDILVANAGKLDFKISAKYFSGEILKSGEVEYAIFRTPMSEDIFETSKDVFEDPSYAGRIEFVHSGTAKLDSKGELKVDYNFGVVYRDYIYIIRAKVSDESYSHSFGSTKIKIVNSFIFLKADFSKMVYKVGENVSLRVNARFASGKKASDQEIEYIAEVEETKSIISKGKVKTDKDGNAIINFEATGKGYMKVSLSAVDIFGNKREEYVYVWVGSEGATYAYTSGNITIVCDKEEYEVGDKASIYVLLPVSDANVLYTVERENIFDYKIKKFKGNSSFVEIPVSSKLSPNFFVSFLMFANNQVYQQSVKIKVPPKEKVLNVKITPDSSIYSPRGEANVDISVSDAKGNGVEADVSIAVINEGLYSLFPEIAPDPRLFFYSYRWNRVITYNSTELRFYGYSRYVREDWSMKIYNKRYWSFNDLRRDRLLTGVKEVSEEGEDEMVRKDFRDNVLWIGSLRTDKKGKANFKIKFPDNIGEFRITAVAFTKDTKVGKDIKKVVSKRDFFISFNMPLNITLYDNPMGYIKVFNSTDKSKKVKLEATTFGGKIDLKIKETNIAKKDSVVIPFSILPTSVGKMTIKIKAIGEGSIDIAEEKLNVIPATLPIVFSESKPFKKGEVNFNINIPSGIIKETLVAKLGYIEYENPLTAIMEALLYLRSYPHGCVEQTTSSFLPSLYAMEAAQKLNIKLPSAFAIDKDYILREGIKKLTSYQNKDGSWGWFSEGEVVTYMTAYVMSALNFVKRIDSSKLDSTVYSKGINALTKAVDNEQIVDLKIYALYVLSEANVKFVTQLKNLFPNFRNYPLDTLALYALALKNSGLEKEALEVVNYLEGLAIVETDRAYWKNQRYVWYDNDIYTTALVLRAIINIKKDSKIVQKAVSYIMQNRKDFRWGSTITTANVVYTLSEYVKSYNLTGSGKEDSFDVYINNQKLGTYKILSKEVATSIIIPQELMKVGQNLITINGENNCLYTLSLKYYNEGVNQPIVKNKMSIKRTFYKVSGNKIEKMDKIKVSPMDVVLVELELTSDKRIDYVVIEDGIPGGFKPVYELNAYNNLGVKFFEGTIHREFARGKANIYINPLIGGTRKYYYLIQAVYPGKYLALCPYVYAMYNEELNAISENTEVEILEK
ncbi:MAG: MG2 domain-containing protein [Brevinematales bacterium]|nr:MG2 domain-containing protein [Brevinematales bacterium]